MTMPFSPRINDNDRAQWMFRHSKSAGANNEQLARILIALETAFNLLDWNDIKLIDTITAYQASIDAKYHDDYKAVATIEELDRRMAMRRSSSLLNRQPQQQSITDGGSINA